MDAGDAAQQGDAAVVLTPYRELAGRAMAPVWLIGLGGNAYVILEELAHSGAGWRAQVSIALPFWIGFIPWLWLLVMCYRLWNAKVVLSSDGFEFLDLRALQARMHRVPYAAVSAFLHDGKPVCPSDEVIHTGRLRIDYRDEAGNAQSAWFPWLRIADPADIRVLIRGVCGGRPTA